MKSKGRWLGETILIACSIGGSIGYFIAYGILYLNYLNQWQQ
jgi:hypothetical protein